MRMRSLLLACTGLLLLGPAAAAQAEGVCPEGYFAKPSLDSEDAPPKLQRGKPAEHKKANEETTAAVTCVRAEAPEGAGPDGQPAGPDGEPAVKSFLDEVRDTVAEYADKLPNFLCEQSVTRFESQTLPPRWKQHDRLSAEVLMVDGKESYRDARRNGKPVAESEVTSSGQWSRGEWGTLLSNLFHPGTRAGFQQMKETTLDGVAVRKYEYEVAKEFSRWSIDFGGRVIEPRYRGAVWIDPETKRVRRVELEAISLPEDYTMDVIEMSVDYGPVKIGEHEFVMPVRSANLSCRRGARACAKNEIVFGNYRQFTAESVITTTDSDIRYDGPEVKPK